MLFSVVIPTYDRRDLLQRALQSVTAQRFADFELIVVDDGSTDDTVEFLRAQHPQVHVVQQANRGPGAARNAGAKKAKGNYLAFLDSDDVWFPWTLDVAATVIARHRASIVSGSIRPFRDERELDDVRDGETVAEGFVDYLSSSQKGYFVGAGVAFVDRAAFLASGGFNEHLLHSEDHDLFLRMGLVPGFAQIISPVTLGYRVHPGGATTNDVKTVDGAAFLIAQERAGAYPGGSARARDRKRILTLHTRPLSFGCLRDGKRAASWWLYRQSFLWHLQLGRWKYLAGFPIKALTS